MFLEKKFYFLTQNNMSNIQEFAWNWTAFITPFREDESIDREAFDNLLQKQIDTWVKWILLLGTTAEYPTLSREEDTQVTLRGIEKINQNAKIMVNIWTNSTYETIENLKKYEEIPWIDAYLVVNPYYNKPTQTGLYKHFKAVADETNRPVFLYNIKWRTWVNLETDTLLELINNTNNIVWVKEASQDTNQITDVINQTPEDFVVLAWDDWMAYPTIMNNGHWVIWVTSNLLPYEVTKFVNKWLDGDIQEFDKWEEYLREFFENEGIQTNPIPIKTALAGKWYINEVFRLPLCPMDEEYRNKWLQIVDKYC